MNGKEIRSVIAVILLVLAVGLLGNFDRKHEIARNMDPRLYALIADSIRGTVCEIADEYEAHQEYYDSLAESYGWQLPEVE